MLQKSFSHHRKMLATYKGEKGFVKWNLSAVFNLGTYAEFDVFHGL